jgi:D-xylose transport system substrate-binding protein
MLTNLKTRRGGQVLVSLAVPATCALALVVAGSASGGNTKPKAGPLVALLLPETVTPRWEGFDRPTFTKALKQLMPSATIDVVNAQNNPNTQTSQAEREIAKGAKVLVVAAIDGKAFGTVARKAIREGVKVIAYDRLINGARISAYVSFDGVSVGRAQGLWLAGHTKKGSRIAVINGSATDDNAHLFNTGYMGVLNPLFRQGLRKQVGPPNGIWTPKWDPPTAQREMEALLKQSGNGVDAVVSANDGMVGGIVAALKDHGLAGKVSVTGQDASLSGIQNILLGTQGMTVLKDFRLQAPAAAKAAAALARGQKLPGANQFVANGSGKRIPSVILPVTPIDESNLGVLVRNGWIKQYLGGIKNVCKGMPRKSICK